MVTPKRVPKSIPGAIPGVNPSMPTNPIAQGLSVALFAAAQDNCDCRACQILKKVLSEMTDQYLKGGE